MDCSVREKNSDRTPLIRHHIEKAGRKKDCGESFKDVMEVAAACFTEIFYMVYTICAYHLGRKKPFTFHGLNPNSLTSKQAEKTAILALSGDKSNGGYWQYFAKRASQAELGCPIFAPDLKYDDDHPEEHEKALRGYVKWMRSLYEAHGKEFNLIVVGHSKGVITGSDVLLNQPVKRCTVQKVISLAGRLKDVPSSKIRACHPVLKPFVDNARHALKRNKESIKLYTIASAKDWKVPKRAVHIGCAVQSATVHCWSHLGIVYSPKAIQKAIEFIKEPIA